MIKFLSKNLPAFGLDVSSGSFKFMQLAQSGKDVSVKAFSEVILNKGVMQNDDIADPKMFTAILKKALDNPQYGRIASNYVVASLPESKSFVRVIQIPHMSESEAENAVPFEAESFIPMPLDQVYLDWQIIGQAQGPQGRDVGSPGEPEKMNILIIATPKVFVEKYLDILDKAGLKPAALEVESQSCHRALIPTGSTETSLLVDMESFRSSMIMVEGGALQFTSTIPIAGSAFTESIARALGVSTVKAEEIKRKVGIANTNEYPNIKTSLLPVLNNLSAEIKNILKFHNEHSAQQVARVVLLGGSSKLANLPQFLAPQLQEVGIAAVELANPWQNLPGLKNPPLNVFDSLNYVTAIGLAERGMRFEA